MEEIRDLRYETQKEEQERRVCALLESIAKPELLDIARELVRSPYVFDFILPRYYADSFRRLPRLRDGSGGLS